jgi:hypothetical protein
MDSENLFHLLYQDNDGNIRYSRLDGQTVKGVPILNSSTPAAYNKQLFLAPFKNNLHFFFVLHHENSFLLAYQVLSNNKIGSPRVVDYVSGSSLPCAVAYDKSQNIFAFYQSYDGKYLQLGYKKLNAAQKSWSEFTPITRYAGNCEYPHVFIDDGGIIHLCYQRRAPKFFEMVYQQKAPDRNLWSAEEIVHSSVHSYESASLLEENDTITVYWVRDDIIYFNTRVRAGNAWGKAQRLSFPTGRPLQCLCYKSNGRRDRGILSGGTEASMLPPVVYPGIVAGGLRLAFHTAENTEDSASPLSDALKEDSSGPAAGSYGPYSSGNLSDSDLRNLAQDTFRQLQRRLDELKEGSLATKEELAKLTNAYNRLGKDLGKYEIRLNLLESLVGQLKRQDIRAENRKDQAAQSAGSGPAQMEERPQAAAPEQPPAGTPPKKAAQPSLDPDRLKEWEDWEEPKEWQ